MPKTYNERWQTVDQLPEGGQSHNFRVKDLTGEVPDVCVLKRLKNKKRIGRFRAEIAAIEGLSHPNVLTLIDYDLEGEEPFLVTKYCEGGTLASSNPYWKRSFPDTLKAFLEVANGLKAAHDAGIIHRDIKPENIFLKSSQGPLVLGDFGLCLFEDEEARLTHTAEAVGPRLYMAPELEDGRLDTVEKSVDIYSLGKVLYWMVAGRIFSREKHRESVWDLQQQFFNPFQGRGDLRLEHINSILDHMVVFDPQGRRPIENVIVLTQQAISLLEANRHPLVPSSKHMCDFCGKGVYELRVAGDGDVAREFGVVPYQGAEWFVYSCSVCGHLQWFRRELGDPNQKWNRSNSE